MKNDLDFEPKWDTCKHCGKRKGEHKAIGLNCPDTRFMKHRTMGWSFFQKDQSFELKAEPTCRFCGKRKEFHQKGTRSCPLGSYEVQIGGYRYFHPKNVWKLKAFYARKQ